MVDTELLECARDAGFATKVIFVCTEDPNLNVGRILIRMARGGQSVPLSVVSESYQESMKSLQEGPKDAFPDGTRYEYDSRFKTTFEITPSGKRFRVALVAGRFQREGANAAARETER